MWNDHACEEMTFNGHLVKTSFCNMFLKLEQRTQTLLFNDVLLGLELPNLHKDHIHDELNNTNPGYSFISDTHNKFHHHKFFLSEAMMNEAKFGDRFFFAAHTSDVGGIAWNKPNVEAWLLPKQLFTCQIGLFPSKIYTELQPSQFTTWFLNKICSLSYFIHFNRAILLFMIYLYYYDPQFDILLDKKLKILFCRVV